MYAAALDLGYSPNETINTAFNAIDLSSESINNEPLFTSEPALNALLDEHIGSLIKIPYKEEHAVVEVLDRKRTNHIDNRLVGRKHSDPTLDTRRYTVRMPNSEIREYTANLVAENLFAQYNEDCAIKIERKRFEIEQNCIESFAYKLSA